MDEFEKKNTSNTAASSKTFRQEILDPMSLWHGTSSGCGWRTRPPDMEGSCKYIE
jgi:hypothetical protein